jgi:hypothetical protein
VVRGGGPKYQRGLDTRGQHYDVTFKQNAEAFHSAFSDQRNNGIDQVTETNRYASPNETGAAERPVIGQSLASQCPRSYECYLYEY